jgi:hypothetical protein
MKRTKVSVAVAAIITLAGCVPEEAVRPDRPPAEVGGRFAFGGFVTGGSASTYGYKGKRSASEEELREQGRKFDKTVWQGVLIGAVAGTVIGAIAGGDAQAAVGGAIIGGSIGALAGMYVANKQKLYASAEDQLESMTLDIHASNQDAEALIADANTVLTEDQRRLAVIDARLRAGQATESELTQTRARAWDNRKVVEAAAVGARDKYQLFVGAKRGFLEKNPATSAQSLDEELSAYRRNIDALDSIAASMGKA